MQSSFSFVIHRAAAFSLFHPLYSGRPPFPSHSPDDAATPPPPPPPPPLTLTPTNLFRFSFHPPPLLLLLLLLSSFFFLLCLFPSAFDPESGENPWRWNQESVRNLNCGCIRIRKIGRWMGGGEGGREGGGAERIFSLVAGMTSAGLNQWLRRWRRLACRCSFIGQRRFQDQSAPTHRHTDTPRDTHTHTHRAAIIPAGDIHCIRAPICNVRIRFRRRLASRRLVSHIK